MKMGKLAEVRWKAMLLYLLILAVGIFLGVQFATYKMNEYLGGRGIEGMKMVMRLPFTVDLMLK